MNKIICLVGIVAVAISAQADYLYWQISDTDVGDSTEWADVGYDLATIYAYTGTDKTKATKVTGATGVSLLDGESGLKSVDVSGFSSGGYSFYIELASTSSSSVYTPGSAIAYSEVKTYEQLANSGSIRQTATLSDLPSVAVWHGGTYKAAPEPTSALLMLLGVAGLALKRKQKKLNGV